MHTKIFAEGFRDKIFDAKIVAALGRTLTRETSDLGSSLVGFFMVAMDQGVLHCFDKIFIPKYSQRVFGITYLTRRLSQQLDVN